MYGFLVRKRIVIGVGAMVAVGALAFVLAQPKKGSVEWHKREYRAIRLDGAERDPDLSDRVRQIYGRVVRRTAPRLTEAERRALVNEMDGHEKALVELGFLVTREVAVSQNSYAALMALHSTRAVEGYASGRFVSDGSFRTGAVIAVTAPANDLSRWEEIVRDASVQPEGSED